MWNLSINSIALFLLTTLAWAVGATELYSVLSDFKEQWPWYVLATAYGVTINEIFAHQICSHRPYALDTKRFTYRLLVFLNTVDHAWGPITSIATRHDNHHEHSDKGIHDNLNWRRLWYNVCLLAPWMFLYQKITVYPDRERFEKRQDRRYRNILQDEWTWFCEEYRVILTILFWLLLYFTVPVILFKVVLMGRFLSSVFMALAAIGGHNKLPFGYRNFDTDDGTHNNILFHYLALGLYSTMLHNNHHGTKNDSHSFRWWEIDIGNWVVSMLRPLIEKR